MAFAVVPLALGTALGQSSPLDAAPEPPRMVVRPQDVPAPVNPAQPNRSGAGARNDDADAAPARQRPRTPFEWGLRYQPPSEVPPGDTLSFQILAPPPLRQPILMARLQDEVVYKPYPFREKPDGLWVAEIPGAEVRAPGFDYYIVVDMPGTSRAIAWCNPQQPCHLSVEGRFNASDELARYGVRNEARATLEYVPYSGLGNSTDYYYRAETEYLYRIFGTLYSLRFGAGDLWGYAVPSPPQSGPPALSSEQVGFVYAYSEAELRAASFPLAGMLRVILGANQTGVGGGAEARMRIGDELGVNFEGGITLLSELGFETYMQFNVHPLDRLSIALAAHVENLPLANQLGFRTYAEPAVRLFGHTKLLLRAGIAARTIQTVGPELGAGLAQGF